MPKMSSSFLTHILLHLMAKCQQNLGLRQSHKAAGAAAGQPVQKHYLPHQHALLSMHGSIYHGRQPIYSLCFLSPCYIRAHPLLTLLLTHQHGHTAIANILKHLMHERVSRKGIVFDLVIHVWGEWKQHSLHKQTHAFKKRTESRREHASS